MSKVLKLTVLLLLIYTVSCLDGFIKQGDQICGQNDKNNCRIAASFENIYKVDVNINCEQTTNQNVYNRFANISKIVWNGCTAHNDLELDHITDKASVTSLQIENFILNEIPKDAFKGFTHLESLVIKNCFIQNLSAEVFEGLKNLKLLNITENTIRLVHSKVFAKLDKLQNVVIGDESNFNLNLIIFDENQILENLTSKSNSRIFNEKIIHIFEHVKNVDLQTGSQEQIIANEGLSNTTIESFSFTKSFINEVYLDSISSIKFLNLSRNVINHNRLRLYSLMNLEILDLSQNSLGYIEELFSELPSLKILDLTSNSIQTVSESAFSSLQNLEKVMLINNNLRDFDVDRHILANVKFYIDENFFDCAKLVRINRKKPELFYSLIYKKRIDILNINFLQCENYPEEIDNSQITTETPEPLKMEETTTTAINRSSKIEIQQVTFLIFIIISIALGFLISQFYLLMQQKYKLIKHQPFYRLLVRDSQSVPLKEDIQSRKLPTFYEEPLTNSTNIVFNNFYEEIPENWNKLNNLNCEKVV